MSAQEAVFAFWGGEIVRLLHDHPHLHLSAEDQGYVWGVYKTDPPIYEADFYRRDGSGVAMMFAVEDVALVSDPCHIRIPQEVLEFWKNVNEAVPS